MATLEQLSSALRNADAAGDTAAAKRFAQLYQEGLARQSSVLRDTGQGRFTSGLSNVGRGVASIVPNVIGGAGYLTGSDTLTQTAEDIERGINRALPVNPLYEQEFSQKAANVLGQAAGTMLTAGAGGAVGKALGGVSRIGTGAQTAALGSGFLAGAREGGQEAERYGMEGSNAYLRTLAGGATELLTEKIPFGLAAETGAARRMLGEALDKGGTRFLGSMGTEAAEEASAQALGNIATKVLAPEGVETPDILEGTLEAGGLGAVGGAAFGGVNALTGNRQPAQAQPSPTIEGDTFIPYSPPQDLEESVAELTPKDLKDPVVQQVAQTAATAVAENADVLPATAQALSEIANETQTPAEQPVSPEEEIAETEEVEDLTPAIERNRALLAQAAATLRGEGPQLPESAKQVFGGSPESAPVAQAEQETPSSPAETEGGSQGTSQKPEEGSISPVAEPTVVEKPKQSSSIPLTQNAPVQFKREGKVLTGTYLGRDASGRHVIESEGRREYSASAPIPLEGPEVSISFDESASPTQPPTTTQLALTQLEVDNEELTNVAKAKWTPEVYQKAQRFYETGDSTALDGLTTIQKARVRRALLTVDEEASAAQAREDRRGEDRIRKQEKADAKFEGKTTFLSAQQPTVTKATKEQLDQVVTDFLRTSPGLPVSVITSEQLATAPEFEGIRRTAEALGVPLDQIEGSVNPSTQSVFVVANQVRSPERAREVLIHELVGHYGIEAVATEAEMQRIAGIIERVAPDIIENVDFNYANADAATRTREILARFSEQYRSADPENLKKGWKRAWDEIKRIIKAIIKRIGGNPNAFDDVELHRMFTRAVRRMQQAGQAMQARGPQLSVVDQSLVALGDDLRADMKSFKPDLTPEEIEAGPMKAAKKAEKQRMAEAEKRLFSRPGTEAKYQEYLQWEADLRQKNQGSDEGDEPVPVKPTTRKEFTKHVMNLSENAELGRAMRASLSVADQRIVDSPNFPGTEAAQAAYEKGLTVQTKARFRSHDESLNGYLSVPQKEMVADADAFLDSMPLEEAFKKVIAEDLPNNLRSGADGRYNILLSKLMVRLNTAMDGTQNPYEVARLRQMEQETARRYQMVGTSEGRALGSRALSNAQLAPIAPILAAEKILMDKAQARIDRTFEGGTTGVVDKVEKINQEASKEASEGVADAVEASDAEERRNAAEASAERIIQGLVRPKELTANEPHPVRKLFNDHLKKPLTEQEFTAKMTSLGVSPELVQILFRNAADMIEGRKIGKALKAEEKRFNAGRETAERILQGLVRPKELSKTEPHPVRKIFNDHLKKPLSEADFLTKLAEHNVGETLAKNLFKSASDMIEGKKISDALKAKEQQLKLIATDSPKLVEMLNALRKKLYPGLNWRNLFMELPSQQLERQREIFRRLRLDERLQGLTQEEAIALTNELDKAWQRERRKVFTRELNKAGALGEKSPKDKEKVVNALPQLLRQINLGVFNSEAFRTAVAPQYGLRPLTAEESRDLRKKAEEAWKLPEGVRRNKKLGEIINSLQKTTGSSRIELLNNYWTASVLSGLATHFDTFMAVLNGMGTNLLQGAALIARGRGKQAFGAHLQWWDGLQQGARESMQILLARPGEADYSILKNFGRDLNKYMEGDSNFRPLPLGESLWKNGNLWEKYWAAPVMMFVGRSMAAADHINNTATTYGSLAVARALHPELYENAGAFTSEEIKAAQDQATAEIVGGEKPTAAQKAEISVRTREILQASMRTEDVAAAYEVGDVAAFQGDPTGLFGSLYSGFSGLFAGWERKLENFSEDTERAGAATRAAAAVLASGLRGVLGAKFMRFGFNFGQDLTRYIPGTYLLQNLIYEKDMSQMQKDLLLGKNIFGLMAAMTLTAFFLGGDDEDDEEGMFIEGNWSDKTPEEVRAARSAGREPFTMGWRNADGSVSRLSYRSWPTSGIFVAVGAMADQRRDDPKGWKESGPAGHLLRAVTTGALQVRDVSAMRGLAEMFGAASRSTDPEQSFRDLLVKTPVTYGGGFIPTLLKDIDMWNDPRNFKPETVLDEMMRVVPILRREAAGGRPMLNILGEEVEVNRTPWRRVFTTSNAGEAYGVLGSLLTRGLSLPEPSGTRIVKYQGKDTPIEAIAPDALWRFTRILGGKYKVFLESYGDRLKEMSTPQAQKFIRAQANKMSDQAERELVQQLNEKNP